ASKLKCDRKVPCIECIKRNIGHLCRKDERNPRAKPSKNGSKPKAAAERAPDVEEAARTLDNFIDDTVHAYFSRPSGAGPGTKPGVSPDYPNMYWESKDRPFKDPAREALVQEVVTVLPEPELIRQLYGVFATRCQAPLGNVFHTPTFLQAAETLYLESETLADKARHLSSTFTMEEISCFLLALMLGLDFHPTPNMIGGSPTPLNFRVEELRSSGIRKTWRSLALRCLQGRMALFCGSIASLQAAVMLLLDSKDRPLELDALLGTAISGARKLGLHNLGDAKVYMPDPASSFSDSRTNATSHVRTEVGIRIWWALVVRDWSRGHSLGYYSIHPSHFNTRVPLHINDDDMNIPWQIERPPVTERPRPEFTMLSYTRYAIDIAILARESIDAQNASMREPQATGTQKKLSKKHEKFLHDLPAHFKPENTLGLGSAGLLAAVPVHKWMLHQQLWSLFLRLHRGNLSSDSRAACRLVAQNIITTYAQMRQRCTVCGSLSLGTKQLFNAAALLLLDMLFAVHSNTSQSAEVSLGEVVVKDKIKEAVGLLKMHCSEPGDTIGLQRARSHNERCALVLEALLDLEKDAEIYGSNSENRSSQLLSRIKRKVAEVCSDVSTGDTTAGSSESPTLSNSNITSSLLNIDNNSWEELDVLPIASNDSDWDFWQFMNFDFDDTPDACLQDFGPLL
ncbi:hypothetical protein N7468_004220, partial [Penicillium chermesinum]